MRKRQREAWAKWRKLVSAQAASGQNVAAFCRGRGLSAPHFFAWKRRIQSPAPFVAVTVVRPELAPASRAIEIRLAGRCSIVVEPGFDASHLRAVIAALEGPAVAGAPAGERG